MPKQANEKRVAARDCNPVDPTQAATSLPGAGDPFPHEVRGANACTLEGAVPGQLLGNDQRTLLYATEAQPGDAGIGAMEGADDFEIRSPTIGEVKNVGWCFHHGLEDKRPRTLGTGTKSQVLIYPLRIAHRLRQS